MFKSDRCGIEIPFRNDGRPCRHKVQIRPLRDWNKRSRYRTGHQSGVQIRPLRDWNQVAEKRSTRSRWQFKSDRCGIEIIHLKFLMVYNTKFKSDRCGIEILTGHCYVHYNTLFKSDRCGIEIALISISAEFSDMVQIRPLRDWNLLDSGNYIGDEQVQIRPLRDWNFNQNLTIECSWNCSNQTVAGLKY